MNILQIIILLILSLLVLVSYGLFLKTDVNYEGGYIGHPLWFGIRREIVIFFTILQILAALGFIISIGSWLISNPESGAVRNNNLFFALLLFFISAMTWPVSLKYKIHWLVVSSLILTAISSIWLLAGSIEEKTESEWKTYRVIGLTFLCIVTVIADGVVWNANYLNKILYS